MFARDFGGDQLLYSAVVALSAQNVSVHWETAQIFLLAVGRQLQTTVLLEKLEKLSIQANQVFWKIAFAIKLIAKLPRNDNNSRENCDQAPQCEWFHFLHFPARLAHCTHNSEVRIF